MIDDEDKVGYRKPPKRSRLQKGKSGNPAGRPKAPKESLNMRSIIEATLLKTMGIIDDGKKQTITLAEAYIRRITMEAINGDKASMKLLASIIKLFKALSGKSVFDDEPEPGSLAYLLKQADGKTAGLPNVKIPDDDEDEEFNE